jgi:hypothetical protein
VANKVRDATGGAVVPPPSLDANVTDSDDIVLSFVKWIDGAFPGAKVRVRDRCGVRRG